MQGNADTMAGRDHSDRSGAGNAAGVSAAEVCGTEWSAADWYRNLASDKMWDMKRKMKKSQSINGLA